MSQSHTRALERASLGDAGAVNELLERHLPGLLAYVRLRAGKRLRAFESSMDLVQSACREVLQDVARMQRCDEANFKHWLYLAVERKIVDHARRQGAIKRGAAGKVGGERDLEAVEHGQLLTAYRSFCTPSDQAIAREDIERIERAFGELPADYRDVIVLSRIVGLSQVEVGRHMHRSHGAVKILLHRALARLALLAG